MEAYLDTGEPVGSRTLSKRSALNLSPASIRNTLADLASAGLLSAPHTSAGRMPTHAGLRLFVDGLLQIGDLDSDDRKEIDDRVAAVGRRTEDVLSEASTLLSGLPAAPVWWRPRPARRPCVTWNLSPCRPVKCWRCW